MKDRILVILLVIMTLATGGLGLVIYQSSQNRGQSLAELQDRLEDRNEQVVSLQQQVDNLESERDRLLRQQQDLHELRAEVTSLRAQMMEASNRVQQAETQRREMEKEVEAVRDQFAGEAAGRPSGAVSSHQELAFQDLPVGVQATLRSQYNGVRFGELVKNQHDGRVTYSMHGEQADGRSVEAILDPQGNVMEQFLDVYLEELPAAVRQTLRSRVNLEGESSFSQIWDAGNTFYTGFIEYDGSEVSVTIGPDGQLREWAETRRTEAEAGQEP